MTAKILGVQKCIGVKICGRSKGAEPPAEVERSETAVERSKPFSRARNEGPQDPEILVLQKGGNDTP